MPSRSRSISLSAIGNSYLAHGDGIAQREELPQRGIDLFFVRDGDGDEFLIVDLVVGGHQRAGRAVMSLANLSVAKNVAQFHQLSDQLHAAVVVPGQVVAVGEV